MEQLNKVILRGIIGSVRLINIGGRRSARLSVATNLAYRGQDGSCVIETTWHSVTAWEGENIRDLDNLEKGVTVEILGRLKNQRYVGSDGEERYIVEVLANTVKVFSENEPLKMEE